MSVFVDGVLVFIGNWQLIVGIFFFTAIITLPILFRIQMDLKPTSVSTGIFLVLFFSVALLLRLAYVSKALLPLYFDSANHYTVIKNIMANDLSWIFDSIGADYYHMGFHFITAFFASVIHAEISTVMLIFGQVILTVMPLPFFFIVRHMTHSNRAGMFAFGLSAFGWYMPAHAVDWGKYPALLSLYLIMLVLGLVYVFVQNKDNLQTGTRIFFLLMLGFSVLFSTFIHSRAAVILGIITLVWAISAWWAKLQQLIKHSVFVLLVSLFGLGVVIIQGDDILGLLFDPYLNEGILVTSLVILLSVFAYKIYPQVTFATLVTMCILLVGLFVPLKGLIPNRDYLTLMDRPYVEMMLFMPLSVIGGLGLAGLEKQIKYPGQKYIVFIGMGLILIYTFANYEFYPSDCCMIVGNDDVAAMAWMADQLPVDARIGVASAELRVVAENVSEAVVGLDAGVWITPLIERETFFLPNDSRFDEEGTLAYLCDANIEYLFVGELGQSFDRARLDFRPAWYRPLLSMTKTRVYEVIGCST